MQLTPKDCRPVELALQQNVMFLWSGILLSSMVSVLIVCVYVGENRTQRQRNTNSKATVGAEAKAVMMNQVPTSVQ